LKNGICEFYLGESAVAELASVDLDLIVHTLVLVQG